MAHAHKNNDENSAGSFHATRLASSPLEQIIDLCSEGILVLDRNDRVQHANRAAINIFEQSATTIANRPLDELFSQTVSDIGHQNPGPTRLELAPPVFDLSGKATPLNIKKRRKLLKLRRETLIPTENEASIIYVTDLTPQVKREMEFSQTQAFAPAKQLAREVSHELNNALGTILMALEALDLSRSQDRELVQIVKDSAEVLNGTTENLRRYGKGKGLRTQSVAPIDLIDIVHATFSSLIAKELNLKIPHQSELTRILIDPNEFCMILLSLGLRAVKQWPAEIQPTLIMETISVSGNEVAGAPSRVEPGLYLSIEFTSHDETPLEPTKHRPLETFDLELNIYRSILGDYNADLDETEGPEGRNRYVILIPSASDAASRSNE